MILENNKYKSKAGFLFPYKGQRLSAKEIAKKAGCSVSMTERCIKDFNEKPEAFVERIRRRKKK